MSHQAVKEYLIAIYKRYQAAPRQMKSAMLNEAHYVTGLSPRQLRRQLGASMEALQKKKGSGRPRRYPREELIPHIRFLWNQMERISPRRMKSALEDDWLKYYLCEPQIKYWLSNISVSTLARLLREIRRSFTPSKGLTSTCPARYMKNKIPINTLNHRADRPGYTQTDTVAHCGNAIAGIYAHSITLTDLDSTWTVNSAIYGKNGRNVRDQFVEIRRKLPFDIFALNSDSGSEFLNTHMLEFTKSGKRIHFTRSRPYHKNDNAYVEEKNFTHVRELFGYERIDDPNLVPLMNEIYAIWNPLQNYFLPTFKLKEKYRVGSKIVKKYDRPKTPYQRLMNSIYLTTEQKLRLKQNKSALNPFHLKADLEAKLARFFQLLKQSKIRNISL